ncbi:MAG: YdcF family protein [Bacteroidota bacterium]|nr:YdcF family protein [Bacteroidota bacterium]
MKAFIHKQSPEVINNRYSAGIVLGGMCNYNEKVNTIVFNETGDRLAQTLRLYNLNIIDKIIVSGGAGRLFTEEKKEADIIKQYLLSLNIPEEDILIEKTSKNTYENAKYTAKLIRRAELKGNFLLISSAQHLPRAQKCFSKQGIETEIYSANMDIGTPLGVSDYFIPQAKTLKDWEKLIHEIIGIWAYRLFGYI